MEVDTSQSDVLDLGLENTIEVQQDLTNPEGQEHPRVLPRAREVIIPIPPELENKTLEEIVTLKIQNGEMLDYNQMKAIQKKKFKVARLRRKQYLLRRKVPNQDLRTKLNVNRAKALVRAYGKAGHIVHNRIGRTMRGEIPVPVKRLKSFVVSKSGIKRLPVKVRLGFKKLPKIIPRGENGIPALILRETVPEEAEEVEYYEEEVSNEGITEETNEYYQRSQQNGYLDANENATPEIIPGNYETGVPALLLRQDVCSQNPGYSSVQRPAHTSRENGYVNDYAKPSYESRPVRAASSYQAAAENFEFQNAQQERFSHRNRMAAQNGYSSVNREMTNHYEDSTTPDLPDFCPQQPVRAGPPAHSFIRRQAPINVLPRRQPVTPPIEEYIPEPLNPRDGAVEKVYVPTKTNGEALSTESDAKISMVHVFSTGIPLHQRIGGYSERIEEEPPEVKVEPEYVGAVH